MKKELTIEHLAAYLPYGLRIQMTDEDYFSKHSKWDGILILSGESINLFVNTQAKPIFRPLSDLTKPITHNGETFVPFEKIERMGYRMHPSIWGNVGLFALPYWVVCELHAMHFDTFGLIEAGLAIDINTLKK